MFSDNFYNLIKKTLINIFYSLFFKFFIPTFIFLFFFPLNFIFFLTHLLSLAFNKNNSFLIFNNSRYTLHYLFEVFIFYFYMNNVYLYIISININRNNTNLDDDNIDDDFIKIWVNNNNNRSVYNLNKEFNDNYLNNFITNKKVINYYNDTLNNSKNKNDGEYCYNFLKKKTIIALIKLNMVLNYVLSIIIIIVLLLFLLFYIYILISYYGSCHFFNNKVFFLLSFFIGLIFNDFYYKDLFFDNVFFNKLSISNTFLSDTVFDLKEFNIGLEFGYSSMDVNFHDNLLSSLNTINKFNDNTSYSKVCFTTPYEFILFLSKYLKEFLLIIVTNMYELTFFINYTLYSYLIQSFTNFKNYNTDKELYKLCKFTFCFDNESSLDYFYNITFKRNLNIFLMYILIALTFILSSFFLLFMVYFELFFITLASYICLISFYFINIIPSIFHLIFTIFTIFFLFFQFFFFIFYKNIISETLFFDFLNNVSLQIRSLVINTFFYNKEVASSFYFFLLTFLSNFNLHDISFFDEKISSNLLFIDNASNFDGNTYLFLFLDFLFFKRDSVFILNDRFISIFSQIFSIKYLFIFFLFFYFFCVFISFFLFSYLGLYGIFLLNFLSLFFFYLFVISKFNFFLNKDYVLFINLFTFFILENSSNEVSFNFTINPLVYSFLVLVLTISVSVIIYTFSYFRFEPLVERLVVFINFFIISMIIFICSDNIVTMFLGWELVGITSFFLINFWSFKKSSLKSSFKAFIFNKLSDFFFIIFLCMIFYSTDSLDIDVINKRSLGLWDTGLSSTNYKITNNLFNAEDDNMVFFLEYSCLLLILCGSIKSCQIFFHIWLPDSMEAPVPASALIHSSTLVMSGIFLFLRFDILLSNSFFYNTLYIYVTSLTAFYGGLVACYQTDVKKILAYSTISNCGFIASLCCLGVKTNYIVLYIFVHGIFKASSFLCTGNIIRYFSNQQDFRKMGGCWKQLNFELFLITISFFNLSALPFSLGFFLKSELFNYFNFSSFLNSFCFLFLFFGSLFSFIYYYRFIYNVFFDSRKGNKFDYFNFKNNQKNLNSLEYKKNNIFSKISILYLVINGYLLYFLIYTYLFDFCNINTKSSFSSIQQKNLLINNTILVDFLNKFNYFDKINFYYFYKIFFYKFYIIIFFIMFSLNFKKNYDSSSIKYYRFSYIVLFCIFYYIIYNFLFF